MKDLITLKIELTPSEANTLCTVLAKGIDYYTYHQDTEKVNPLWLWGVMNDLSNAVYKQSTGEDMEEKKTYNMSNDELAEFLCERCLDCDRCMGHTLCTETEGHANGLKKWLR